MFGQQQQNDMTPQQRAYQQYTWVTAETCRRDLRKFVRRAWPLIDPKPFQSGWHIDAICDHLTYLLLGDIRNLMIAVPPRTTKSSLCSVAFPAWCWTDHPELQFLTASYAQDLSVSDSLKMRALIDSEWYQERYGDGFSLLHDRNKADRFYNTKGGYRISISVGSKTTGLGGDIKILDDPNNASDVEHEASRKQAINWHDNAWKSRNNDPNTVRNLYVAQRTHTNDVLGHVLAKEEARWVYLCLPMEYDGARKCITYRNKGAGPIGDPIFKDPREKPNALLCPERYNEETIEAMKDSTPTRTWNAQSQQQPEGAGGLILKRNWWKKWGWPEWHPEYRKSERPLPEVLGVIQAYDTAFEEGEQDSFCVRTTWILFEHQETIRDPKTGRQKTLGPMGVHAMLVERKKWRPSYNVMREEAKDSAGIWEPDYVLIEKKASGHSLIKELRQSKLPVKGIKIHGDLVYRAHIASWPLEKGHIWYVDRAWAVELIDVCAKFPSVEFDDEVSSSVIAMAFIKSYMAGALVEEDEDEMPDDLDLFAPKTVKSFYGGQSG